MILLRLFFEFFKVGLFSVGGGLATIPFLTELSEKTGWFTLEELTNMIAIGESTPGPIGVNMATYAGFITAGAAGSVIATLGLVAPSILVILLVARILDKFRKSPLVDGIFQGLRPASVALIAAAGVGVFRICLLQIPLFQSTKNVLDLFQWKGILLAIAVLFASRHWKKVHPIVWIGISAAIGVLFRFSA